MILLKNGGGSDEKRYQQESKGVKRGEFVRKIKRKETCKRPLVDRPNKERYLCGREVSGVSGHVWLLKKSDLFFFFFFSLDLGWGVTIMANENLLLSMKSFSKFNCGDNESLQHAIKVLESDFLKFNRGFPFIYIYPLNFRF